MIRSQLDFLERTLSARRSALGDRRVAPPTVLGRIPGFGSADSQGRSFPSSPRHGVDLVLSAHDHDYQRSHPIDGVTYIVTGGAAQARFSGSRRFTAASVPRPALRGGRGLRRPARRASHRPAATRVRRARPLTARPHGHARSLGVRLVASAPVIKYLGSKRRLVPVLGDMCAAVGVAPRARPVHRHDPRRAGVQAAGRRHHRRRQRALRVRVRGAATSASTRTVRTRPRSPPRSPISWRGPAPTATSPRRSVADRASSRSTTAGASTRCVTRSNATTGTRGCTRYCSPA